MDLPGPFRRHVRVDLGGRDVGVAEHRLDRQQVPGKGVAQRVRGDPERDLFLPIFRCGYLETVRAEY